MPDSTQRDRAILEFGSRPIGTFSRGIAQVPRLSAMLGGTEIRFRPSDAMAPQLDAVIGWGRKDNTAQARSYAQTHGLPFAALEDGFLRSVRLGVEGDPPLAVVVDPVGIYYDATRPSAIELILEGVDDADRRLRDPALLARASAAIERITNAELSKYNFSSTQAPTRGEGDRERVLVVDQVAGDLSARLGLVPDGGFECMLNAACSEHPTAKILVKTHPDVLAGVRTSSVPQASDPRIEYITTNVNPIALLKTVDHVYVGTSQLGFEALLLGKPVTCFGVPFYAGWGITDDRVAATRRSRSRSIVEVFAAAYLLYSRYLDPETGGPGELEDVITHLETQRNYFRRNAGQLYCFGFARWKRRFVRQFLRSPDNEIHFCSEPNRIRQLPLDSSTKFVVWGHRDGSELREVAAERNVPVWRVEDGFLRSVGLGSDIVRPASLVVDCSGVYYDPRGPSDLEAILGTANFSERELERAARLREAIVRSRLSKYNLGVDDELGVTIPPARRIILVPGQVEDDASVRTGSPVVPSNTVLLQEARRRCPEGFLVYKPHPDVVSGNRKGKVSPEALVLCDLVTENASIARCLDLADEIHTMTSLVGFEALLRGKRVVVYGAPFYAGWGLTEDLVPLPRRQRNRSIDELVAACLIRYPRYLHSEHNTFTTPETVVRQLAEAKVQSTSVIPLMTPWPVRQLRKVGRFLRGLLDAS